MIIDGRKIREDKRAILIERVSKCTRAPHLVIVSVGNRSDSETYINAKKNYGQTLGIDVSRMSFEENVSEQEVIEAISKANKDNSIDGIICQLPLPSHIKRSNVVDSIAQSKDVDALSASNVIRVLRGDTSFLPATTKGIITLLNEINVEVSGKNIVVIGRSDLVGKPTAQALLAKDATVTVAHSKTADLSSVTQSADIIISATGSKNLITKEHVKAGQVIIDVGINKDGEDVLHGDVDFAEVEPMVAAITPVPGGVGPMTVHSLFENLLDLVEGKVTF